MPKNSTPGAEDGPRRRTTGVDREALAQVCGTITALTPQRKRPHRRSVFVDGQFVLGLHQETISITGLQVGQQVDGAVLLRALHQDEYRRALDHGARMLAARARSRRDLERRLARRYAPEVAAAAVDRLVDGGWLDDAELARSYVRSRPDFGHHRLRRDLVRMGIDADTAEAVIQELVGAVDQEEQARKVAAARLRRMKGVDRDTAQRRLYGYLLRRGFDTEVTMRVLTSLLQDLPRKQRSSRQSTLRQATCEEDLS